MGKRGPKPGFNLKRRISEAWSANLAYAVGLLASDGCLSPPYSLVDLTSNDREQLENFCRCVGVDFRITSKKSSTGKESLRVQFKSVLFYNFLLSIGLTPAKSKTLGKLNIPILYFGFIHAALVIGQIAVSSNFAKFENLAGSKKRYILISGIVAGIGFIVVAFTQNAVIAVGAMIVLTAFGMTRKILLSSYLNKHINSKVRATVLSTVSMFSSLAMAIGDIFFGIFADKNLTATLATVGILIIVTTIIIRIEEKDLRD